MECCVRCKVGGEEVRLFDAVYLGKIEKICERCSIIENVPLIKKPAVSQLKEAERGSVYSRMKRLSGLRGEKKRDSFFVEDRLRELEEKPELALPEKNKLNLIEHFHWEVMRNRRRKGLSQEKLAENIGESATAIQMVERGKLPENAEALIRKLEQFFQVKLRKISETERIMREREKARKPVLLDIEGRELEKIPEPEIKEIKKAEEEPISEVYSREELQRLGKESENQELEERDLRGIDAEKGELDIHKANLSQLRISDLRELHRRKVEATKQEKEEEKRRIAERQKLIEARKEELRLMREKESEELEGYLGGTELLKKDPDADFEEEE